MVLHVCTHGSNVLTALRTKLETFPFLLIPLGVSCLSAQKYVYKTIPPCELTMRYLDSERSIFLELLPLSFGAVEQNSRRNEMSLFMIPWIHNYEKKTTSACEDC
jgi:hypothetical protein